MNVRKFAAKVALATTTVSLALGSFVGTAQAADINMKGLAMSNNATGQTGVTSVVTGQLGSVGPLVNGCIKITWGGGMVTTGGSAVTVDWSNDGTNNVTTGATAFPGDTAVTIPFTGSINNARIFTATVTGITNQAANTYDVVVTSHATADCSGAATDTSVADANAYRYTITATNIVHNVAVAKTMQYVLLGQTTHQYKVNPANAQSDMNANTVQVQTNADSYNVYLTSSNTDLAPKRANGNVVFPAIGWTGSHAAPENMDPGDAGFGYNIGNVANSETAQYADLQKMAAFVATGATSNPVLSSTNPTAGNIDSAIISYQASTNWGVKAGDYTFTTVYSVVPVYN